MLLYIYWFRDLTFEFMADVEHCQTTIVRSSSTNQLLDGSKMTSLRGKTKKRGTSRHDMKFDRLSDHDKVTLLSSAFYFSQIYC